MSDGDYIRKELSPLSGRSETWRGLGYCLPCVPVLRSFRCVGPAVVVLKLARVVLWSTVVLVSVGGAPDP